MQVLKFIFNFDCFYELLIEAAYVSCLIKGQSAVALHISEAEFVQCRSVL